MNFLGTISGKVLDDTTGKPLAGSVIRLLDSEGNLVINKEGWAMQVMTDDSGVFVFDHLPMGTYTIFQINPSGYDSIHDMDDINDNKIIALLDVVKPESKDNNFMRYKAHRLL
ncbi:MAG: carboxypeptidase regulatory-like domain-containing protein [Saprospiraceae bacterium]|nr:carboxypeptidase regulatory-like domain-containing protein [Saprospiraceae bacterium]